MNFRNYEPNGYSHNLDLFISCTNCVFYILQEVGLGCRAKIIHLRHIYLSITFIDTN